MSANRNNPPHWLKKIFEWYCHESVAEDLIGDMDELFKKNLLTMSAFRARWRYAMQVVRLLFSSGLRIRRRIYRDGQASQSHHSLAMYASYSKIAFRNLSKQKTFSFINMICLSVGMSVGLLALAVWMDVMEVDAFQSRGKNIYRVTTEVRDTNQMRTYASSSAPLAEKLNEEIAGIEEVVQLQNDFNPEIVQSVNTHIPLSGYFASSNFFGVFSFPMTAGNAQNALDKPFSMVLTQSAAEKLFGKIDAVGKTLEVKELGSFEVTGVIKDYPRSHFFFEALASYSTLALLEQQGKVKPSLQDWGPVTSHYTYLLVKDDPSAARIKSVIETISAPNQLASTGIISKYRLQSFTSIPLSDLNNEIGLSWGGLSLIVFFSLALLVLLPACFNYANISIARALRRAKEIGLRKVSGGQSSHIFFQMVLETVIISVISLAGAVLIFLAVRDGFLSIVVHGSKTFDLQITPLTVVVFLIFGIFAGILAGIFPAVYFSKLNPIETLRNASHSGNISKISIRKGLIVAQFALSLFFILSVAIIFKQYRYALNYNMGFQKENILDIPLQNVDKNIFETELEKIPEITSLSMSSSIAGNWETAASWAMVAEAADSLEINQMFVDQNYIENLELKLLAGSGFPEETSGPEKYVIVNETLVQKFSLGTVQDALGRTVIIDHKELRVIGVVKDFNYMPLREAIQSFCFRYDSAQFRFANVKLKTNDIQATLAKISASWKTISDQKFEARFLDDELDASLVSLRSMIKIFGFLGLLAVTISCLGLLAVVISAAESRTKEMGIRKIVGASIADLALSLSKGFLKLISISILVATPVTYFIFDKVFLRINYYHATIGITEMALGILLLLVLILLIIGSQTLKVAKINPVESLKYE